MSLDQAPGGRFNALVVEDSPPMRKMIVFALSRIRELDVTEADDGVDALRRIASTKFDIIITTEGAEEDRQRALALGANAYITKPIQAPQVIKLVRETLGLADGG